MTFAFLTLGCKANQFDTQAMVRLARQRGHEIVPFTEQADVYVVNTCTVTAESDRKSRQMVRAARRRAPDAVIGVCGCFAQVSPDAASALGADVVSGTRDRAGLLELLERAAEERRPAVSVAPYVRGADFEILPAGGYEGRTRALLKVQDGCDNYCSYCIIPYARGHVRSLPLEEAAGEAKRLKDEGYPEIVLTGIEISSYGVDLPGKPLLTDLLEALCAAAPGVRIHLGSLEPGTVTPEFCRRIGKLPDVLPHFHLSLQSGCDATLRRMRRRYLTADFAASVALLRELYPNAGITADLITGFPGETEEEFSETLAFIESCAFSAMHVFPYSERPGTPAAAMEQLPRALREARAREASRLAAHMRRAFLARQVGRTDRVLFEAGKDGLQRGHTTNYLPVSLEAEGDLQGSVRSVRITGFDDSGLRGELSAM